ncbi:LCP family protein [Streptomyces sp. NPDC091272]|uniref:LCP family protein n=1 Tax=Streptomyces sp. NPDC091272 TaxID=3365981 RepID=UPI0038005C75
MNTQPEDQEGRGAQGDWAGQEGREGQEGLDGRDGREGQEGLVGRDGRDGQEVREVQEVRERREARPHPPGRRLNRTLRAVRSGRPLRLLCAGVALLVGLSAVAGWLAYRKIDGNIRTDEQTAALLAEYGAQRPAPHPGGAQNILLLGSDWRQEAGSERSDTVMLLHVAADRRRAEVLSVPRDLRVDIPSCLRQDGEYSVEQNAQFNWAFQFGGAACTIRTLEKLTGIRIDHHLSVDFTGFKKIVNAVGGVEVNVRKAEHDPNVGLDLSAGKHLLKGETALSYVRARSYVGDGSDLNRISRQQDFVARLAAKIRNNGTLANPARLFPVLDAATSAVSADTGLDSLSELYGMVQSLQELPPGALTFHTVPHRQAQDHWYRLDLEQPEARRVFEAVQKDTPLAAALRRAQREPAEEPDEPEFEPYHDAYE